MRIDVDESALARRPQKPATRDRFEGILKEAEAILVEQGISGFSIPVLAARLGYTRASIYRFFPTPYAVLNEISLRYFEDSAERIDEAARASEFANWRELLTQMITYATAYYNERPVARLLLLGGALTDMSFSVQEQTNASLGNTIRTLFQERDIVLPSDPDPAWITVDIIDGILRHSQYRYGHITAACSAEAIRASIAYLGPLIEK